MNQITNQITNHSTYSPQKRISNADVGYMILLLVTIFPYTYKIISPFMILTGFGGYTQYINTILYIIGVVLAIPRIKASVRWVDVIMYCGFAAFFFLSQYFYPISERFVNENAHDILVYTVSLYFLGVMVNYQRDRHLIQLVMRVAFIIGLYWELCLMGGLVELNNDTVGEQMTFAYPMLVVVTYMMVEYFYSHKVFELIGFIIGSLLIMIAGSRGPVLLWALFIAMYILLIHKFKHNSIAKKIGIIIVFAFVYAYITPIITALSLLSSRLGMSTKVFDSVLGGSMINIQNSSDRDLFYDAMIRAIQDNYSGFGYGFGSDRLFSPTGGYAHNFELEILVQFGILGGGLVFLALIILFLMSYRRIKGSVTEGFCLVIVFWGIMSLQFSMSWLIHPGFFFMIGYFVSILRTKNEYLVTN